MSIFCFKKLNRPVPLATQLKSARENRNLSLEMVAKITRVPIKYLQALDSGDCASLPTTKAHCLAYIKAYATLLNLNVKSIVRQFILELDSFNETALPPKKQIKINTGGSFMFFVRNAAAVFFVILFVGYLGWQINGILKPPELTVYTPSEGMVINSLSTVVQGETKKAIMLTINGKEVRPNEHGLFEASLDLSNGVNTITIAATKKHGKTTTITRHVVVNANAKKISVNKKINFE